MDAIIASANDKPTWLQLLTQFNEQNVSIHFNILLFNFFFFFKYLKINFG